MRLADIYYEDLLAGTLTETDEGDYIFRYDSDYVDKYPGKIISFSFPVSLACCADCIGAVSVVPKAAI